MIHRVKYLDAQLIFKTKLMAFFCRLRPHLIAYNGRDETINISAYIPSLILRTVLCDLLRLLSSTVHSFIRKVHIFKTNSINMVRHVYNNILAYQWLIVETENDCIL